ncbi:prephenate dehydratase [Hydrogenibacillus sp. N12]|uniref:prephenate dehydratase n=1 Tax=Hydrogenibacillus sp. N12 TaxID=2866627 RepID=UPI001C7DA6B9|nr:prephenate dehydratase [Hydrogenibacillus sp. N12]QZA33866.1 prephenate dehydratase [Hydrogenibacillus sp. N12]
MVTLAYLGPEGSYSEEAAREAVRRLPLADARLIPLGTIPDVLEAVDRGEIDYGIVPVENSIEGSVTQALDWLIHEVALTLYAEIVLPIDHGLYVAPAQAALPLEAVEKVLSHPQAVAQAHRTIRRLLPRAAIEPATSTSEAMRRVAEHPEARWAAVGSRRAAERFGLVERRYRVQDYEENATRFVVVGRTSPWPEGAPAEGEGRPAKSSLLVTLGEDFPGALHQVLACFSWRRINLSRIESRPTKKGLGRYHFFIDAERPRDLLLAAAMEEIEALGCRVRFLGSYPVYAVPRSGAEGPGLESAANMTPAEVTPKEGASLEAASRETAAE